MPNRPWITSEEVKEYTDYESVKSRDNNKVKIDITRAEQTIISYTNNSFEDTEKYPQIPVNVKTATILLAEAFGFKASLGEKKKYKSETFDDYSYTLQEGSVSVELLELGTLLEEYVVVKPKNGVTMNLRKL